MPSISKKKKITPSTRRLPPMEIGWREWAAFPGFGVQRIKAKIDTGAKTSAIHAYRVREVAHAGAPHAEFFLHPLQKRRRPEIFCLAPIIDRRLVRSSNGAVQERIFIRAVIQLGDRTWPIDMSLANRDEMGFRLLIGRDALRSRVIIHPARSFILGK